MTRFGLEPRHIEILEKILRKNLLPNQKLIVWIFGSRATGKNRPFSDIDLLLEGSPPVDKTLQNQIEGDLEDSNLPFKVDLVPLETLYPPYAPQIHQEKQVLFQLYRNR